MHKAGAAVWLSVCLLMACHNRQTSPAPTQTAAPAQVTATDVASSVPSAIANQSPAATKSLELPPQKVSAVSTSVSAAAAEPAAATPQPPAPDTAVFDKEELIDTSERLLHPYAAQIPQAQAGQHAPWAYEQLKYGIYYGFIKAGTAYIRNRGLVKIAGRPAYFIQTTAFSAPVIDAFFKVRDINQSWIDAADLYSYGYGQSVREGNYKRDEWLSFDYTAKQYHGQIQKKESPKSITGPLDMKVLDMLSALYYVRGQTLAVGQDITFDIVNRQKQYPLVVKVLKKETVKTAAGKFNCVVVEPQMREEGIFVAKGKSLKVWLTDDAYKMPVKMTVEVFIGSVSAELLEYQRQAPANIL